MVNTAALRKQKLLSELNDAELAIIAKHVKVESYPMGKMVFMEGDATVGVCMVNIGKVEISKSTPDGWKQTLAVLPEQQFFGELSVIEDRKAHSTNATALDKTELYLLTTEVFKSLEKSEPVLMYKVMKTIARMASRNVHTMNEKLMKALISY